MRARITVAIVTVLAAVTIFSVIRYRRTKAYRPAEFTFAVLGDAPYDANEEVRSASKASFAFNVSIVP